MATEYPVPTTEALDALFEGLTNWGRWGVDDQRGTLNFLTDECRAAAAGLVLSGQSISLAHDLATQPMPDHPNPVQHHMLASGDARDSNGIEGYEAARDHLALDVHGLWTTHVDALSHMFVKGRMYGGWPASEVRSDGARANTVLSMADGVIGRGILLDVPACPRGRIRRRSRRHRCRPRGGRDPPGCAGRAGRHPVGGVGPRASAPVEARLRRVLRATRRVPPVAGGAGGGRAR